MNPKVTKLLTEGADEIAQMVSGLIGPGFDSLGFDPAKASDTIAQIASALSGTPIALAPGDAKDRVEGAVKLIQRAEVIFGFAGNDAVLSAVLAKLAARIAARKPPAAA